MICLWELIAIRKAICNGLISKLRDFRWIKIIGLIYVIFKKGRICIWGAWGHIVIWVENMRIKGSDGINYNVNLNTVKT